MPAKIFSLVLATYGRMQEVDEFLYSLATSNYDLSAVEVLIVDQNSDNGIDLGPLVLRHQETMDIRHIKSAMRGSSLGRNIGLRLATGKYIAFPDDDCIYYSNTLTEAEGVLNSNTGIDVVLGRVVDRITQKNIIREWKNYSFPIVISNFFFNYTAITIFSRKIDVFFDEELGLGAAYGAYEDADYIVQALKSGKKIQYNPCVEVWHPDVQTGLHSQKIYSYGLGFGALCRKHFSLSFSFLFAQSVGYHFLFFLVSMLKLNKHQATRRYLSMISRIRGFINYTPKKEYEG